MEKPKIEIDQDAIRFEYGCGGHNLFWRDLFITGGKSIGKTFQNEIMEHLFNMYNQCVKENIKSVCDNCMEE